MFLRTAFVVSALGFMAACGGPSREAKIATAVQSIMANALSANLDVVAGRAASNTGPFECSGGGDFSFNSALSVNPSTNGASGSAQLIYNDCVYKVCGDTVTLNGNLKSTVSINVALNNTVTVTLTAASEAFTGVLDGDYSFSYKMTTSATTSTVSDFNLQDNGTPLTVDGTEYSASTLNSFADGC